MDKAKMRVELERAVRDGNITGWERNAVLNAWKEDKTKTGFCIYELYSLDSSRHNQLGDIACIIGAKGFGGKNTYLGDEFELFKTRKEAEDYLKNELSPGRSFDYAIISVKDEIAYNKIKNWEK